nr:hypothetical protein [Tanacetum cinerariifolium]
FDGLYLGAVAERRARAVGVDVIDLFGLNPSIAKRVFHYQHHARAARVGGRDVVRIRRHAAADELAVDFNAPSLGVLILFEHQRARAFAQHKAVALFVVGPRGRRGVVVALAHGLEGVEATHARLGDGRFGAARHDGVGEAQADVIEGRNNSVI